MKVAGFKDEAGNLWNDRRNIFMYRPHPWKFRMRGKVLTILGETGKSRCLAQPGNPRPARPARPLHRPLPWLFAGAMLMRSFEFTGEHDPRVTVCLSPWISMPRRKEGSEWSVFLLPF